MLEFNNEHIKLPRQKNRDGIPFKFQAVNKGTVALKLELQPTCGCTNIETERLVSPNTNIVIEGTMNKRTLASTMNVQTFKKKIHYKVLNAINGAILKKGSLMFEVELEK